MTLVEGHGDYVMDAVGPKVVPSVAEIRAKFSARRASAGRIEQAIRRILGIDLKMKQYEQGAQFVKTVVDEAGMEVFNKVWTSPETLPTRDEITNPRPGWAGWTAPRRTAAARPRADQPSGTPMGPHAAVAAVRLAVRRGLSGPAPPVTWSWPPAPAARTPWPWPRARVRGAPGSACAAGGVTVDHGLQAGSADQAERVAKTLAALGLDPVPCLRVTVAAPGAGPEAAARAARYAALDAAADATGASAILLGHTRDDQAETVLLGLARGSGARSLAGMPERNGRCLRPLLSVSRAQTRAACAALDLSPGTTRRTPIPAFARVRVRHRLLPALEAELGPGVAEALARTAGSCAPTRMSSIRSPGGGVTHSLARRRAADRSGGRAAAGDQVRGCCATRHRRGLPGRRADRRHVAGLDDPGDRLARAAVDRPTRRCPRPGAGMASCSSVAAAGRAPVDATDMGADLEDVLITPERLQNRMPNSPRRSTRITLVANCFWSGC